MLTSTVCECGFYHFSLLPTATFDVDPRITHLAAALAARQVGGRTVSRDHTAPPANIACTSHTAESVSCVSRSAHFHTCGRATHVPGTPQFVLSPLARGVGGGAGALPRLAPLESVCTTAGRRFSQGPHSPIRPCAQEASHCTGRAGREGGRVTALTDLAAGGAALEARGVAADRDDAARSALVGSPAAATGYIVFSWAKCAHAQRSDDAPARDAAVAAAGLTCEVVGGHLVHVVPEARVHLDELLGAHGIHVRCGELRLQRVLVRGLLPGLQQGVGAGAGVVLTRERSPKCQQGSSERHLDSKHPREAYHGDVAAQHHAGESRRKAGCGLTPRGRLRGRRVRRDSLHVCESRSAEIRSVTNLRHELRGCPPRWSSMASRRCPPR